MDTWNQLRCQGITTRVAAELTGMQPPRPAPPRAAPKPVGVDPVPRPALANKLTTAERARVLGATDQSTVRRRGANAGVGHAARRRHLPVLKPVKERHRLARHPKAVCPEPVATAPKQVY